MWSTGDVGRGERRLRLLFCCNARGENSGLDLEGRREWWGSLGGLPASLFCSAMVFSGARGKCRFYLMDVNIINLGGLLLSMTTFSSSFWTVAGWFNSAFLAQTHQADWVNLVSCWIALLGLNLTQAICFNLLALSLFSNFNFLYLPALNCKNSQTELHCIVLTAHPQT